jgi:hypothetical protein
MATQRCQAPTNQNSQIGAVQRAAGSNISIANVGREIVSMPVKSNPQQLREVIAGFSLWDVQSIEAAVERAKHSPMAPGSEAEIRPH